MTVLQVSTRSKEKLSILPALPKGASTNKKANGLCHLFLLHTTAALTTADLDLERIWTFLMPSML